MPEKKLSRAIQESAQLLVVLLVALLVIALLPFALWAMVSEHLIPMTVFMHLIVAPIFAFICGIFAFVYNVYLQFFSGYIANFVVAFGIVSVLLGLPMLILGLSFFGNVRTDRNIKQAVNAWCGFGWIAAVSYTHLRAHET